MSCGNPHAKPCSEVLEEVYHYLDGAMDEHACAHIRAHLDECGHCLREYGVEQEVKALVARSCGCEPAPAELKSRLLIKLQAVVVEGRHMQISDVEISDVEFRSE